MPVALCKTGSQDDERHLAEVGSRIFSKKKYRDKATGSGPVIRVKTASRQSARKPSDGNKLPIVKFRGRRR